MAHWKHTATRCAVPTCTRVRVQGHSTCALLDHYKRGVALAGQRAQSHDAGWPAPAGHLMRMRVGDYVEVKCAGNYRFGRVTRITAAGFWVQFPENDWDTGPFTQRTDT